MSSWEEFRTRNPNGLVMVRPDFSRDYGANPYAGYDSAARPFLFNGELPPNGVPALMRVLRVGNRAWPTDRLARAGELREAGLVITWKGGQASALDSARIGDAIACRV